MKKSLRRWATAVFIGVVAAIYCNFAIETDEWVVTSDRLPKAFDGLRIAVQFWHGDEEFAPRLRYLWDENALRYLRYETTWFATGLLMQRLREHMG